MNIYITLDYELFFGKKSGSVEKCIIEPTERLLDIVKPFDIKFVCFVDVGYLVKLQEYKNKFTELAEDYRKITEQIKILSNQGHGIELHIHPHWEDTYYDGSDWVFDTNRYRLADFSETEVEDIITKYATTLSEISGKPIKAYRAGGWSAQPFNNIAKGLLKNNILIDSTVFPQGYYHSEDQFYDFRDVDRFQTEYRFSSDLTQENTNGSFTEIPISAYKVSPFFFWKFAYHKLKRQPKHNSFGDGIAIAKTKKDTLRLMTNSSFSVVSIDGYKASYLKKAFKKYCKKTNDQGNFVIIGHPKAFTPYSLEKTKAFIKEVQNNHTFKIFE